MTFTLWFVIIGGVFMFMALANTFLERLPLTASIFYLGVGLILGPIGFGFIQINPANNAEVLEHLTEIIAIISVFSSGLQLRTPLVDGRWKLPVRLATLSMLITVGLITLVGVIALKLPVGAAILLGGMLAPTDPVLASDVQVEHAWDQDRLRFSLTGEAAMNDGTATPFVLLGLGLLGLHEIGNYGWLWVSVDILWGIPGGLLLGTVTGTLLGRLILYLRREHKTAIGLDDFVSVGLIGLTYGLALMVHVLGFLAVFAAGLALRRIERENTGEKPLEEVKKMMQAQDETEIATSAEIASAYMTKSVLGFTQQLERIGEVMAVLVLGGMLAWHDFTLETLGFAAILFFVIRPVSVWLGLWRSKITRLQRGLIGWLGIRGVAAIYYLTYAIDHDLPPEIAGPLTSLTLVVTSLSILLHGISVTPLMNFYTNTRQRRQERRKARAEARITSSS